MAIARPPPDTAETLAWLEGEVWPRLVEDARTADEIIGYDADGLFGRGLEIHSNISIY